jgi:cytochrome P450
MFQTPLLRSPEPGEPDKADEAGARVEEYYESLIPARRERPRADLVSALVGVHDGDEAGSTSAAGSEP